MSGPVVITEREAASRARDRGNGVRTLDLVTRTVGTERFLTGITEFPPGAELAYHWHDCEESVVVLSGQAVFHTEQTTRTMVPCDATWVPAGVAHRFRNDSTDTTLRILWIYGSPEPTRTFAASGRTVRVGDVADTSGA